MKKKKPMGLSLAGDAIGGAGGALVGHLLQPLADKQRLDFQDKLNKLMRGEQEFAMGLQKQFWDETNYGAQVEHMMKAGLNPALMYDGAGGGGSLGAVGGAGGGQADSELARKQAMKDDMMMGLMVKKQMAEINKIEADADKTRGDTLSLNEQKFREGLARLELNFGKENYETELDKAKSELKLINVNLEQALIDKEVAEKTKDEMIEEWALKVTKLRSEIISENINQVLTKVKTEKEKAAINELRKRLEKIDHDMIMDKKRYDLEYLKYLMDREMNEWSRANPSIMNIAGRYLNNALENIEKGVTELDDDNLFKKLIGWWGNFQYGTHKWIMKPILKGRNR